MALYSSTAGGYTENYSLAFSDPLTRKFPSDEVDYLKAVPDKPDFEILNTDEKATITRANSNYYDISITNEQGQTIETRKIKQNEIKEILYSK